MKLRHWWDKLSSFGPDFGYFPNASKSWLVVKEGLLPDVSDIFLVHHLISLTLVGDILVLPLCLPNLLSLL